jgi:hypothetical protein
VGPFSFGVVSATAGAASAAFPTNHGLAVDDIIIGSGFLAGARITATGTNNCGLNVTITGLTEPLGEVVSATANRDLYAIPSDLKKIYSGHLLGAQRPVRFRRPRTYDRTTPNTLRTGTVYEYDISRIAGRGKIRMLPTPADADILDMGYYRRMYLGSASGDTTALDIPEDFEWVPLAFAKWHFLTDKKDNEQATTWFSLSEKGIESMLHDNTRQPDEDLGFTPGHAGGGIGDNDTSNIRWETS